MFARLVLFTILWEAACITYNCLYYLFSLFFADNVYQPSRCGGVIEELRQCCIKNSAVSLVCEGIDTSKPYEHNTVDYVSLLHLSYHAHSFFFNFISYLLVEQLYRTFSKRKYLL